MSSRYRTDAGRWLRLSPLRKVRPGRLAIKTLTIDRARWLHGGLGMACVLRNEAGWMDVFGFLLMRMGLRDQELINITDPIYLRDLIPLPHRDWLIGGPTRDGLMRVNDDLVDPPKHREKMIKLLLQARGIECRFIGRGLTGKQMQKVVVGGAR